MLREDVFKYAKEQYAVEADYPWGYESPSKNAVLRHQKNGKWFGIVMDVPKVKLELEGEGKAVVLNVKCDPITRMAMQDRPGVLTAYHMNKEHWITIVLEGGLSQEEICKLIDLSYSLTS